MTSPRTVIALAIERADKAECPDNYGIEVDHEEISDWGVWLADSVLSALKAAGLAVVPVKLSQHMKDTWQLDQAQGRSLESSYWAMIRAAQEERG